MFFMCLTKLLNIGTPYFENKVWRTFFSNKIIIRKNS